MIRKIKFKQFMRRNMDGKAGNLSKW